MVGTTPGVSVRNRYRSVCQKTGAETHPKIRDTNHCEANDKNPTHLRGIGDQAKRRKPVALLYVDAREGQTLETAKSVCRASSQWVFRGKSDPSLGGVVFYEETVEAN